MDELYPAHEIPNSIQTGIIPYTLYDLCPWPFDPEIWSWAKELEKYNSTYSKWLEHLKESDTTNTVFILVISQSSI